MFQENHPLSRLYQAYYYLDAARTEKNWRLLAWYANEFCYAYANLSQDTQEALCKEHLTNAPSPLGELSTWSWIAYLASLRAIKPRWERLGEAIRDLIVGSRGEDFLPAVQRPVSSWDYEEPPF
jgi:hypothetical protein